MEAEIAEERVAEAGLDFTDPYLRRVLAIARQMIGMPRHLSQHVGGFILTERPLIETVPVGNGAMPDRTFIEWDKDDIEELGILKIDVLALGMLTCIRKAFDLIERHHGERWTLATIPLEERQVYDMLCKGDSLGVFQVESRAQMNMLPRLSRAASTISSSSGDRPPGPIQGDMVHPYLKRRSGKEPVTFPCPDPSQGPPDELEQILGRTLGVPIFQEQAMKIALDAAKFSSEEANQLRKAMATFRSKGNIELLQDKMVGRMVTRGYDPDFAQRCFDQIKGFGEYGFPESHAASFAHLVYVSSWLRWKYPAAFAAALLNSQPMGFYAPAQIVRDAREHGVEVRAVDVNHSDWDCTLEALPHRGEGRALRLGLRQVEGFHRDAGDRLVAGEHGLTGRSRNCAAAAGCRHAIERLAEADAFRSMDLDRRAALWDSRALKPALDLPLFVAADARDEGEETETAQLPAMPLCEHVVSDYQTVRLSLKAHPMTFLREHYTAQGFITADRLKAIRDGKRVSLAGLVLIRQRPGSAKGVCFITLEDGDRNRQPRRLADVFEQQRRIVMGARLMVVHGVVQKDEDVIHVVARKLEDGTNMLRHLSDDLMAAPLSPATGGAMRPPAARHPREVSVIPKSRDFH
jgi:error-prone DNA polymerase